MTSWFPDSNTLLTIHNGYGASPSEAPVQPRLRVYSPSLKCDLRSSIIQVGGVTQAGVIKCENYIHYKAEDA